MDKVTMEETRRKAARDATGGIALFLALLLVVTGGVLLLYFRPDPATAQASLLDFQHASPFGTLRGIHAWGSHALLVAMCLYFLRTLLGGGFHGSRRRHGLALLALFVGTFLFAWTGSLLPRGGDWLSRAFVAHVFFLPLVCGVLLWFSASRREGGE